MKDKCIILSRVSTLIQDLVQQTEAVRKQALADGYEDIVFIEDKESAVKLDEESRLGLTRLKNMILSDPTIKCVYAYELSRIGRRPEVNYNIRNFLQEHRVQLIILSPYMKVFDDDFNIIETSNVMFGLFNVLSENEGFIRKARFKRGKLAKQQQGKYIGGGILLGYKLDTDKSFIVDKEASEGIRMAFDMYVRQRKSLTSIGRELITLGYLHRKSLHGVSAFVYDMLSNEAYKGGVSRGNIYPPIVDESTFNAAGKLLEEHRKCLKTSSYYNHLCKGLLREKKCGYVLTAHGKKNFYYLHRIMMEPKTVLSFIVPRDIIDGFFIHLIDTRYGEIEQIDIEERKKQAEKQIALTEKKIESTRKVLENCDKKTRRIQERIVDGKLDEKMGDDMIREIQDKVLYAEMDLRKFKNELTNQQLHRQSLDIIWPDEKTTDCTDTEGMEKMRQKLFRIVRVAYVERIKDQKGISGKIEVVFADGHTENYWYNSWTKKVWDENNQEVKYQLVA